MTKNVDRILTCALWVIMVIVLMTANPVISQGQVVSADSEYAVYHGTIISATSKEPVTASIRYESMPYASMVGIRTGAEVSFPMNARTDYLISVRAEGYSPYIATIRNSEIRNGEIQQTIELIPTETKEVIRLEKVIFAQGRAELTSESFEELDRLAEMLRGNPNMVIQLEGHTDFRGDEKENMKLSERRVKAVKDYLIKKGIQGKRIATKAFGGSQPLTTASDPESRSRNRRVEVRILSN